MTDEKVIDAEFDKDDCGPFDSPISAYKAGFRTAERLAKIEVLDGLLNDINSNGLSYLNMNAVAMINARLKVLKAGN